MTPKKTFSRYLVLLCAILLAGGFYLPVHYNIPYPAPLVSQFSPTIKRMHLTIIEESRPDLVLIGDSVLESSVDADLLFDGTGLKSHVIYLRGSGTAAWYLLMKSNIAKAAPPPKYVAIMFRNTMLTVPQYRTTGRYRELLDDYATDNESLLMELAFISQMSPLEKFSQEYFPLYSSRLEIREDLDNFLRYQPASILFGMERESTNNAIKSNFGREVDLMALNEMMENASKTLYAPEEMNFEKQVSDSFLPFIIQLAQKNGINLIFIRTGILGREPAALAGYSKSLDSYLSNYDHVFLIDLSNDPRVADEFYADGLHFNEHGKVGFTHILAGEINKIIENDR